MPWYFAVFLLISLSSIAVPGTNGFVGEFLILIGAWSFSPSLVVVAALGVILAAGYVLWMVKRVFYGELSNPKNQGLPDLSPREAAVLLPLVVLALVMGIASPIFTRRIEPAADALVRRVREATRPAPAFVAEPAPAVPPAAESSPAQPSPSVPTPGGGR
jgi:NADH-quinone oxidoreductase subunit M